MLTQLTTATAVGTLDTIRGGDRYRIASLRLDAEGDGVFVYWMTPGEIYRLFHRGVGWSVAGGGWFTAGHSYQLTRAGVPISGLPMNHLGSERLDPYTEYQVHVGFDGDWELWSLR